MATSQPKNSTDRVTMTLFVKRQTCNGMTVKDHADGVIAGTHSVLTHEEFEQMFGACDADIETVINFVTQHGMTVDYAHCCAASVIATGTVGQINSAFGITLNNVIEENRTYMNYAGTITLPDTLQTVIEYIDGLDTSLEFFPGTVFPTASPTPGYSTPLVTPQKAATAYDFPGNNNGTDGIGQVIGIIAPFGTAGYTQQNLTSTFATYGILGTTVVDYLLDGCTNNPAAGNVGANQEIMLDIAMVAGIVPKSTIVVYICNTIASAMNAILFDTQNKGYRPKIVSMSFGGEEGFVTNQADILFAQATALGVTLIASSGDWGPYNLPITTPSRAFKACWPASNPNVLAVGGTSLLLNSNGTIASEVTWNNNGEDYYITGGNQSSRFSVPSWQTGITLKNYSTGISSAPTGRAVPDVALVGDYYTGFTFNFYWPGSNVNYKSTTGGGTSASAPLWAGLIARINQLTGRNVGFVTAKFYNNTGIFNDILPTNVANNNAYLGVGFSTTTGWDACTGWGSPKGQAVYNLLATGSTKVKLDNGTWQTVQNIKVKTDNSTWSTVKKAWVKNESGWQQTY